MKHFLAATILLVSIGTADAEPFDAVFPNHPGYQDEPEVDRILRTFNYRQGLIVLPGGRAELQVPEGYYYLGMDDADTVLTELWGNPNGETLGMIFPTEYTPWDEGAWGAVIQFDEIGYVSDVDAEGYDYDALLVEMKADTKAESQEMVQQGFDSVELIGWAEPPSYDPETRKLHWAKEFRFGADESSTLNYDLRALGRYGVLQMNFVAGMDQLDLIKHALPEVSGMVSFVNGQRYTDFDPSVDKVAAVGVAGLIAGKVLTSKAGLLAAGLLLLKKFWIILLLPLVWFRNMFRRS